MYQKGEWKAIREERTREGRLGGKIKDIFPRMPLIFEKRKYRLDKRTAGQALTTQPPLAWDRLDYFRYIQSCLDFLFRKTSPLKSGIFIFIFLFLSNLMAL